MKRMYGVSYTCIFTVDVEAESPAEAAELAEAACPYDIDSAAFVWRSSDEDPRVVIECDEDYMELPDYDDAEERGE